MKKFLLCFRPVVDMELMLESKAVVVDRSQNQALKYVGVKNQEIIKPSTTKSSVSDTENSIVIHRPGKKKFSQVVKAVVFEIILVRRVLDRKSIDQGSYSSKHNFPVSSRAKLLDRSLCKSNKALAGKQIEDTLSKSDSVSSISPCSPSSSKETQKLQNNNTSGNNRERTDRASSSNTAIFLLLVSLAVTIFWGKICAILFTSIWVYFFPHQKTAGVIGNLGNAKRIREAKSRENRKKVIMEGLLERNHNRGTLKF